MLVSKLANAMLLRPFRSLRAKRTAALLSAADALRSAEDRAAALRNLERAAELDPDSALVHCLMGRTHAEAGAYGPAAACFERALGVDPGYAEAHIDLGTVYRLGGQLAKAAEQYRTALAHDRPPPLAHYNLALVLLEQSAADEALRHLRAAHSALPEHRGILKLLVLTLIGQGAFDEAAAICRRAIAADASNYEAWLTLGLAEHKMHRPAEALSDYAKARELRSNDPELMNNEAVALQDLGKLDEALQRYDEALLLRPDFPLARFHRALAHLMIGRFEAGWPEYETRLASKNMPPRPISYPRWDGSSLRDRSVLVYGEQGLGDEIMFSSCIPDLLRRARHCAIECTPRLQRLFQRSFPEASVFAAPVSHRIPVDFEVPIGSLPLHFRQSAANFPNHSGYLKADRKLIAKYRERLAALGRGAKIGISWRGGTHKTRSPLRSLDLQLLASVLNVPGTRFVSLQYTDDAESEITRFNESASNGIVSWADAITDYDETAALVSALDFTISVCTAVVHLAGALGRPVWVMAPYSPEWRYGYTGESMAWYPSVRMFRQKRYGDWADVIHAVSSHLRAYCAQLTSE